MAERITIDELKSYLWQSAVLLRTHIDAGAYKQYIFPLMFFKRICDVYDEETAKAVEEYGEDMEFYPEEELHTFLVPKGHHWNDVRQVTEDVGAAIVKAFREIEKANGDKMTGIFTCHRTRYCRLVPKKSKKNKPTEEKHLLDGLLA